MRLTKTLVERVPVPAVGQAFYRDDLLLGFAVRVTASGVRSFVVEKRIDGKVRRQTLGRFGVLTVEQARREAQKFLGQVATGRDVSALGWDWRRIKREGAELLADKQAYTAPWGQATRLVTGPYASAAAAQQAVTELKQKGLDTFAFTSAEGEVVSPLR